MSEREKRDFQAGLEDEVNAFLRGEPTRRTFIKRFGQAMGMLPIVGGALGSGVQWALAQAKMELEDPNTPLGKAQALAFKASTEGPADGSAFRAVEAAKQFAGVNLNMTYEAGLQGLHPRNFSGPLWGELTGIKSTVVELPSPDMYSKPIAEHIAQSGAYDILDLQPQWTPALADGGVIAPLDDLIAKYMNPADLEDYHPLYKALPTARTFSRIRSSTRPTRPSSARSSKCRNPGRTMRRLHSSSPIRWHPMSTAPDTSARQAARATSSTSCSSSVRMAARSSMAT